MLHHLGRSFWEIKATCGAADKQGTWVQSRMRLCELYKLEKQKNKTFSEGTAIKENLNYNIIFFFPFFSPI